MSTEVLLGCDYSVHELGVTGWTIGVSQTAHGWIHTVCRSIYLFCDPVISGRSTLIPNEPADTTDGKGQDLTADGSRGNLFFHEWVPERLFPSRHHTRRLRCHFLGSSPGSAGKYPKSLPLRGVAPLFLVMTKELRGDRVKPAAGIQLT